MTENKHELPYASTVARQIRHEIFQETNLTASAGVSVNKFFLKDTASHIAKMASDINKPNGITVILPEDAEAFVKSLPIEKFYGIGKVTAAKMHSLGIYSGYDLRKYELSSLIKLFGKVGRYYYNIARAKDSRVVEANRIRTLGNNLNGGNLRNGFASQISWCRKFICRKLER